MNGYKLTKEEVEGLKYKVVWNENHKQWMDGRKTTIGASDVPIILGLSKYKSPYALWAEKTGRVEPFKGNIATRVGHALEDLTTEFYEEETGQMVCDCGDFTTFIHRDYPFWTCTPDRVIFSGPSGDHSVIKKVVELKTMGENAAKQFDFEEPPLEYQVQLQSQMAIVGVEYGDLAVLVGNRHFYVRAYERNASLILGITKKVEEFYRLIENDIPPEIDDSESTARALVQLHPDDNGNAIEIGEPEKSIVDNIKKLKSEKALIDTQIALCENMIKEKIGDNTFANGYGYSVSWKTQERKPYLSVDVKHKDELLNSNIDCKVCGASKTRVLRIKEVNQGDKE